MQAVATLDQNGHLFTTVGTALLGEYLMLCERYPNHPLTGSIAGLYHECSYCGQTAGELSYDETTETVKVISPCAAVDGVRTVFQIVFPSGKVVVSDDLRPIYDVPDPEHSYNTAVGQAEMSHAMAAIGCAYGAVQNTCPSVYRTPTGEYLIASGPYDEESGEPLPWENVELAGICTDLWAYSLADRDDYLAKGGIVRPGKHTVIDVEPGVYEFTHHTGERGFNWDAPVTVFATFKRV